eukprot:5902502-Lingulodinium_polyedra.AAC.1
MLFRAVAYHHALRHVARQAVNWFTTAMNEQSSLCFIQMTDRPLLREAIVLPPSRAEAITAQ